MLNDIKYIYIEGIYCNKCYISVNNIDYILKNFNNVISIFSKDNKELYRKKS